MAAPTNITAATAVVISSLPYSITQQVDFAGTTYDVWYSYTATVNDTELSIFGFGDLTTYQPEVSVFTGPASLPVAYLFTLIGPNLSIQVPVAQGTEYFFKFTTNAANPSPAVLTLAVKSFSQQSTPVGSIAINDDSEGFPLVIRSATTGDVIRFVHPFPDGEAADILASGVSCWHDLSDSELVIFDHSFTEIATIPSVNLNSLMGTLRTCLGTQRFWFCYTTAGPVRNARYVTDDGTLGTAHVLTGIGDVQAIAVSNDESILYSANSASGDPIKQWDLVNDVAMSNLVAGVAPYFISDILVLDDDSIVAMYSRSAFATFGAKAIRYDAAGATLNTYDFGSDQDFPAGTLPRLAYATDSDSFWAWTHPFSTQGISLFQQVRVSDGTILTSLPVQEYETGVYNSDATATPSASYGNSFSCPFLILRTTVGPVPPDVDLNGPGGLDILRAQGKLVVSPIRRVRITPHVFDKNQRIFTRRLELLTAPGKATVTGQGEDPVIALHVSNDGGETYPIQRTLTTGRLGAYTHRCYTHQLGAPRDRVYKFISTDPVTSVWIDVDMDIDEGLN